MCQASEDVICAVGTRHAESIDIANENRIILAVKITYV
jgi:hypothetical protein